MSESLNIEFLDSKTLDSPLTTQKVVRAFTDFGFAITRFKLKGEPADWTGMPEENRELLRMAYQAKSFSFTAWNDTMQFEVRQYLSWDSPEGERNSHIRTITDNTPYFWEPETHAEDYSRFYLDIAKRLYKVLHPTFGWIDFTMGQLYTTDEDVENLKLPALYWANFFGPSFVSAIGREHLHRAPAGSIKDLADGGLLYVLASSPGTATDHVSIDEVKAYFGIDRVR